MKSLFLSLCSLSLITATIHGQPNDPANAVHQQLFGEGVISTPFREWTTTFTPDGQTVYFSRGNLRYAIIYSERVNGKWQKPKLAPFSGRWSDTDPFISSDGMKARTAIFTFIPVAAAAANQLLIDLKRLSAI